MGLADARVDVSVVALWLVHSDVRATSKYLHADLMIMERALALTTSARHRARFVENL